MSVAGVAAAAAACVADGAGVEGRGAAVVAVAATRDAATNASDGAQSAAWNDLAPRECIDAYGRTTGGILGRSVGNPGLLSASSAPEASRARARPPAPRPQPPARARRGCRRREAPSRRRRTHDARW